MEQVDAPTFPVIAVEIVRRGPFWLRKTEIDRTTLPDVLSVEDYLEVADTRGDPNFWLEDAQGQKWDVRVDHCVKEPSSTKFSRREPGH